MNIIDIADGIDRAIKAKTHIVIAQWLRLCVIHLHASTNGVEVIVGTPGLATTFEQARYQLLIIGFKTHYSIELHTAIGKKFGELSSLWESTGKSVEQQSSLRFRMSVDVICKDIKHQIIGDKIAFRNIGISRDTKRRASGDVVAKKFSRRDMKQIKTIDKQIALRAFSTSRSTKYHYIHCITILP